MLKKTNQLCELSFMMVLEDKINAKDIRRLFYLLYDQLRENFKHVKKTLVYISTNIIFPYDLEKLYSRGPTSLTVFSTKPHHFALACHNFNSIYSQSCK